jgi:hypothetical protein
MLLVLARDVAGGCFLDILFLMRRGQRLLTKAINGSLFEVAYATTLFVVGGQIL